MLARAGTNQTHSPRKGLDSKIYFNASFSYKMTVHFQQISFNHQDLIPLRTEDMNNSLKPIMTFISQHENCLKIYKEMNEKEMTAKAKAKAPEPARKRGRQSVNTGPQPANIAIRSTKATKPLPPLPPTVGPSPEVFKDPETVKELILSGKGMFQALFRDMVANNKGQVKFSVSKREGGGEVFEKIVQHLYHIYNICREFSQPECLGNLNGYNCFPNL